MFALISRMLRLSGRYKKRIQLAFVCAFVEQILSKMPIFFAFLVLAGFASGTMSGARCLAVGAILVCVVVLQAVVHYASDRLQSAAGYMIFADQRIALADHLRRLPMGYFTAGNIGKISSVLSSDMVFVEEVAMSTIANMMSYLLSAGVLMVFMFWLDWRLGLIALAVTLLANVVARRMNAVSLKEAAARQEQGERLTDAVLSFVEGIGVIKSYNLLGAQSAALTENFARSRDVNAAFERQLGAARSIDVARWLDVSKPSVCHAMKKLIAGGYLTMDVEHLLQLSEKGRDIAAAINKRHCFFRDYLIACGVDPVQAEEDACRLEHALSAESFEKLKQAAR